jgi:hypothetical protein
MQVWVTAIARAPTVGGVRVARIASSSSPFQRRTGLGPGIAAASAGTASAGTAAAGTGPAPDSERAAATAATVKTAGAPPRPRLTGAGRCRP